MNAKHNGYHCENDFEDMSCDCEEEKLLGRIYLTGLIGIVLLCFWMVS